MAVIDWLIDSCRTMNFIVCMLYIILCLSVTVVDEDVAAHLANTQYACSYWKANWIFKILLRIVCQQLMNSVSKTLPCVDVNDKCSILKLSWGIWKPQSHNEIKYENLKAMKNYNDIEFGKIDKWNVDFRLFSSVDGNNKWSVNYY